VWVVPSDRGRTYFRQNCSQEFLAAYLVAYVLRFVASLADRAAVVEKLHLRPPAGMHPRCERHFATTPVAEIVAHSGGGIVDKGAEASAMAKRLIVCCDGT
jgi:hypothetical protein